jgi:hypothetical protein
MAKWTSNKAGTISDSNTWKEIFPAAKDNVQVGKSEIVAVLRHPRHVKPLTRTIIDPICKCGYFKSRCHCMRLAKQRIF